jgi:uncharacterized membrane protein
MNFGNKTIAGSLLFVGGVVYIFGFGAGAHYGNVQVENASIVVLGLLMVASAYFVQKGFKSIIFSILIALAGIGTIGIGVATWSVDVYNLFAAVGYIFFGLSAIMSYKFAKSPFSYISIALGALALIMLGLWASGVDLGGGIIISPISVDNLVMPWLLGFGAHIIGASD